MTHTIMKNMVAVVTGGSSGIGAAIVDRFVINGAEVVSLDLDKPEIAIPGVIYIDCDVTKEESVIRAFNSIRETHPLIDVLCANAGIVPKWARIQDTSIQDWEQVMGVNVNGLFLTIKHAAKSMRQQKGSIVVTGSLNSWKGDPNIASYVASKHGALGIIKSAAIDLGASGIRVNGIAPGPIATPALLSRIESRLQPGVESLNQYLEKIASQTFLNRIASVDEVINTIEFLSCEKSSGITGQLIHVDCGV